MLAFDILYVRDLRHLPCKEANAESDIPQDFLPRTSRIVQTVKANSQIMNQSCTSRRITNLGEAKDLTRRIRQFHRMSSQRMDALCSQGSLLKKKNSGIVQ
jgi:hypothetical protein